MIDRFCITRPAFLVAERRLVRKHLLPDRAPHFGSARARRVRVVLPPASGVSKRAGWRLSVEFGHRPVRVVTSHDRRKPRATSANDAPSPRCSASTGSGNNAQTASVQSDLGGDQGPRRLALEHRVEFFLGDPLVVRRVAKLKVVLGRRRLAPALPPSIPFWGKRCSSDGST